MRILSSAQIQKFAANLRDLMILPRIYLLIKMRMDYPVDLKIAFVRIHFLFFLITQTIFPARQLENTAVERFFVETFKKIRVSNIQ